jgi:hypothetical protein
MRVDTVTGVNGGSLSVISKTHAWDQPIVWIERAFGETSILLVVLAMLTVVYLVLIILYDTLFLSGFKVVAQIIMHYLGFASHVFDFTLDGNPSYFDALPLNILQWRIDSKIISGPLLTKYKERLNGIKAGDPVPERLMRGLETYNICYSPDYSIKFGLDTNFLWRYAPKDWLVPANADTLHSDAPTVRRSILGVFTKKDAITRIFEDGKYEDEVEQLLLYCAPLVVVNDRSQVDIIMRKRNYFYSSKFDNNTQSGARRFKGRVSVSKNYRKNSVAQDIIPRLQSFRMNIPQCSSLDNDDVPSWTQEEFAKHVKEIANKNKGQHYQGRV